MKTKKLLQIIAPFTLVIIAILFVLNLVTHGSIQHPGLSTYQTRCAPCHGDNGEGIKTLTPPLFHADLPVHHLDSVACWIKYGMNHPIKVNGIEYDQPMYLSDIDAVQTANVINFLCKEYWNYDTTVNSIWVKEKWKNCN